MLAMPSRPLRRSIAWVGDAHAGVAVLQGRDAEAWDAGVLSRAHVNVNRYPSVAGDADRGNSSERLTMSENCSSGICSSVARARPRTTASSS